MTILAAKFTPGVLLSAPRRSAGLPNSDGSKVLYSVSTYSFSEHVKKSEIRVLDVESQQTSLVTDSSSASDPKWIGDDHILILESEDDGTTSIRIGEIKGFSNSNYTAGKFKGPVGDLKIHALEDAEFGVVVSAKATPHGTLFNPKEEKKPLTTGRLYKSLFARHWDHWITENHNSLFLAKLSKSHGKYVLSDVKNALRGTKLESPIEPFGGTDHFDISVSGLAFTSKDPELDPATHTKTNIYLIRRPNFWDNLSKDLPSPEQVQIYGFHGASTAPVFSPNGKAIAFLSMKTDGYESDKNQPFIVPDIDNPSWVIHAFASEDGKGKWDRSPSSIIWGRGSQSSAVYFSAEDHGRGGLFVSDFTAPPNLTLPEKIIKGGSIVDIQVLKNGDLFISSNSLIDNSLYSILPVRARSERRLFALSEGDNETAFKTNYVSSITKNGAMFGLSRKQIDEVQWPSAKDKDISVHAWVVKPSHFNPDEKYPLAYLIHGGPQGAWEDGWSTRWNPAVFAEQGYVVIAPNPTGSTGYGQQFTDDIQGQWGGLPYQDLVLGFEWIKKNLDYIDIDRSVALGASYGGYMVNWIQGHDLGRSFKALVTHDGVFSMTSQLASEELYFPFHEFGAPLWKSPDSWSEWDPSRFTRSWETPQLVIHSELDYRLTIAEGLAAFHTLQVRGVESQFLTFPDENHWVLKPENSLLWHQVVLDWINVHVGLPKYSSTDESGKEEDRKKVQHATSRNLVVRE